MIREFPLGRSLEPPAECSDDWEHDGIVRISHLKMSSKVGNTLHCGAECVQKTSVQAGVGAAAAVSQFSPRQAVQQATVLCPDISQAGGTRCGSWGLSAGRAAAVARSVQYAGRGRSTRAD